MPRVIQTGRNKNRNSTAKAVLLKPYDRPSSLSTSDDETAHKSTTTPNRTGGPKVKVESKPAVNGKGDYNKPHLVALILKSAVPDWDNLSKSVGKTPVQCRDTWRRTISPALLDGKPWSVSGPGWDEGMKIKAVLEVFGTSKPDWAVLGNIMGGKTASQVKDVWRKIIFPRLKKGMTIE